MNKKLTTLKRTSSAGKQRIRYAIVGLGWISQSASLTSCQNAGKNSELATLFEFRQCSHDAPKEDALMAQPSPSMAPKRATYGPRGLAPRRATFRGPLSEGHF